MHRCELVAVPTILSNGNSQIEYSESNYYYAKGRILVMRKRILKPKRVLALVLILCISSSLLPLNAMAASALKFKYSDEGQRIGIKSIVIDGITYYDIYDGDFSSIAPSNTIKFLSQVLTSPDNTAEGASALDYWSQLAYHIFKTYSSKTVQIHDGNFESNFGGNGRTDLIKDLQQLEKGSNGGTIWSGLSYASSLMEVRQKLADSVATGIDRKISGNDVLSNTDSGNALEALNNDKTGTVLYTMATTVRVNSPVQLQHHYNAFGLAFYDFELTAIADNGLEYITSAEGYVSIKDAAENSVPGVTYAETGNSNSVLSYYENAATLPSSVSMEFTQSNSTEVSNSITSTETYSFRETIGSETQISSSIPSLAGLSETIKLEFTAEQALSTAWKEEKTVRQQSSNTVATNLTLPAHTAVAMDSSDNSVKVTLDYDCPVAISYKVAVFSLAGDCYDDGIAVQNFNLPTYWQKHFCTVFGGSDANDARESLNNRVFVYKDMNGYEETHGSTYGWTKGRGPLQDADILKELNWNDILGDIQDETSDVEYIREGYEVIPAVISKNADDSDILGYIIAPDSNAIYIDNKPRLGVALYDNAISAPVDNSLIEYTLIKGAVYEKNGSAFNLVDNTFPNTGNSKIAYLDTNKDKNVVKFYYVRTSNLITALSAASTSGLSESDISLLSSTFDTMVESNTLINWLCKHVPMSSVGGTVTLTSRTLKAKIYDIVPLYPLRTVRHKHGTSTVYDMLESDVLDVNSLEVEGFNGSNIPYFGFDQKYGHWELIDETGAPCISDIAWIQKNALTGRTTLVAGSTTGTVYLKYVIDENRYTAKDSIDYSTNESINTAFIQINVFSRKFDGYVEASGSITGYEKDTINILSNESDVSVHVFDDAGIEINVPVTWEKQFMTGLTISGNSLTFDAVGDYFIRANYRGKSSEWLNVRVNEMRKLNEIIISKEYTDLLDDYFLNSGFNTFDLSLLDFIAKDQYDNDWPLTASDLTWWYQVEDEAETELSDSILTVFQSGHYTIWAESGGIKSNKVTLLVNPESIVHFIEISGVIPTLDVNPRSSTHIYDLNEITVVTLDQYGNAIELSGTVWEIDTGKEYATINGSRIFGLIEGTGTVRLTYNGIYSNALPYSVEARPYVHELYYAGGGDYVIEGVSYDLSQVGLTAKDQWGQVYNLSADQIADIVWNMSAEVSTVDSADIALNDSVLTVATGSVDYAATGTLVLSAVLPDRGDGIPSTALFVTLHVRQAPILAFLEIALKDSSGLRSGQNSLVSEFFTTAAKDQYGANFPITIGDLKWKSDNDEAFKFEQLSGNLAIIAISEDSNAQVTAEIDVARQLYKDTEDVTITSNSIFLSVPGVRRIGSISVTGAPSRVYFDSSLNISALRPVVYDNYGIAFTTQELAEYPAKIAWTFDSGNTGSTYDASTGLIKFGRTSGTVTLVAMVVNSSSSQLASTEVKIYVEANPAPNPDPTPIPTPDPSPSPNLNLGLSTIEDPELPLSSLVSFDAFIYGYEDGKFHGENLVTREQFVAILYRLNADDATTPADETAPSFNDIAPDRWSYDAIEWALSERIIEPDADGNFNPKDPITRADMAVMLVKSMDDIEESTENTFTDIVGHKDIDYILKAVSAGLFNGYPDGTFRPNNGSSRTEVVTALIRYLLGGEPTEKMLEELEMPFSDVPMGHWAYGHILLAAHGYTGTVDN